MADYLALAITPNITASPGFSGSPSSEVSRYTAPSPTAAPDNSFGQQSRAQDHSTVQRCSTAELGAANEIQAVSPTGRPLAPSEITPDTIVSVGGLQMKAAQAERLGLLTKGATGYGLAAAGTQAETNKAQAKTEATDADKAEAAPAPALPQEASDALQALAGAGQDTVGASLEFLDTGELSPGTAARLATRLGIEPGQVLARVEAVAEGFREVATGLIGGAEAMELAAEWFPDQLDKVSRAHVLRGDVSGYKALAAKVTDHLISSAQSIECDDPTLTVRTVHGRHLVSGKGIPGEVELKQAVRLGLVHLS